MITESIFMSFNNICNVNKEGLPTLNGFFFIGINYCLIMQLIK